MTNIVLFYLDLDITIKKLILAKNSKKICLILIICLQVRKICSRV